jgi:hypothetical protein
MKAVFLDYDTVSTGDLDTAGLKQLMPGLLSSAAPPTSPRFPVAWPTPKSYY